MNFQGKSHGLEKLGTEKISFLGLEKKCWTASVEGDGAHPGFEPG